MNKTSKESEEIMNDELVETEPLHELVRKIAEHDTFVAKTTLRMDAEYAMLLYDHASVLHQAADELITARNREDALTEEVEALRAALKYYAHDFCELGEGHECCGRMTNEECSGCKARAALKGKDQ